MPLAAACPLANGRATRLSRRDVLSGGRDFLPELLISHVRFMLRVDVEVMISGGWVFEKNGYRRRTVSRLCGTIFGRLNLSRDRQ
jgi:hypothetical protein